VDVICRVSHLGVVLEQHPEVLLGATDCGADSLVGRRLAEWVGADAESAVEDAITRAAERDEAVACEWRSDEHPRGWWRGTFIRVGPDDVIVVLRDLTPERCRTEAEALVTELQRRLLGSAGAPPNDAVIAGLRRATDFVGARGVIVAAIDNETNELSRLYEWTPDDTQVPIPNVPAGKLTWLSRTLPQFSHPVVLDTADLPADASVLRWLADERELAAMALIPMTHDAATIGVAGMGFPERPARVARLRVGALGGLGTVLSDVVERRRLETAHRESAVRLEALVEHTRELIAVIAADGHVQYVSPIAARLAGYIRDSYRAEDDPIAHVVPADRAALAQAFQASLEEPGKPIAVAFGSRSEDGRRFQVEGTFTNLLHVDGVKGVVLNARDVTEQRAATAALERRAELDALAAAISRDLLDVPPTQIVDATREALGRIASHLGADAATLGRKEDNDWFRRVCSWHEPRTDPLSADAPEYFPPEAFPWIVAAVADGQTAVLYHAEELPREAVRERELLARVGAKSAALVSVHSGGDLTGYITLYWREQAADEGAEVLAPVRVIGDVLTVAYDRAQSELARAEADARADARFRSLVEHASDGIIVFGPSGVVEFASPSVEQIYGRTPGELIGLHGSELIPAGSAEAARRVNEQLVGESGRVVAFEARITHANGEPRWVEATVTNLVDNEDVNAYVLNVRDVSERKQFEQELEHQALHDSLTDLPNRALLVDRLEQALARAHRNGRPVGLLFLDLDRFKYVNDSRGHGSGDELLRMVAERIRGAIRPADTVARFGGDEFVVLLDEGGSAELLLVAVERVRSALEPPFLLGGVETFVTASIGIASSQPGQERADEIIRDADAAMYRAKDRGRDRYEMFDPSIHARAVAHLETTNALCSALVDEDLRLHYQPIVRIEDGRILGLEALLRWQQGDGTVSLPEGLIAVAEETGLIVPIGAWVLDEACRQMTAWTRASGQERGPGIGVNLSVRQLREPDLVAQVDEVSRRHGVDPSRLMFEITESVLADDTGGILETLHGLRGLGVRLVIDDFGTGYSSLAYLKRLPVMALKIDQAFVDGLGDDAEDTAIVTAIVGVARGLDLEVVAEGVETERQVDELRRLGVAYAQGFYFAPPAPADAWEGFVGGFRRG
jgi:diguanylate cyclase (GGDEF)-like protein/PAS domain S-box-containing protein